jgi:hypothetical protein
MMAKRWASPPTPWLCAHLIAVTASSMTLGRIFGANWVIIATSSACTGKARVAPTAVHQYLRIRINGASATI